MVILFGNFRFLVIGNNDHVLAVAVKVLVVAVHFSVLCFLCIFDQFGIIGHFEQSFFHLFIGAVFLHLGVRHVGGILVGVLGGCLALERIRAHLLEVLIEVLFNADGCGNGTGAVLVHLDTDVILNTAGEHHGKHHNRHDKCKNFLFH